MSFDPRNSEQLFFLGLAYEHAGRTADAMARYSEAAALDPSNADILLGLARLALRANKVAEARRAADAVLARFPSNADALLLAGLVAERQEPAAGRAGVSRACARGAPRLRRRAHCARPGRGGRRPSRRGAASFRARARTGSVEARGDRGVARARRRESLMRIVWSRAIASVFWFATAAILPAERHPVRVGAVPQARARAGARDVRGMARLDLAGRARRLRGGACALAAVGPRARARVHRGLGDGRRGAVLRAAVVAARTVRDRPGARPAVARAAGVDRLDAAVCVPRSEQHADVDQRTTP